MGYLLDLLTTTGLSPHGFCLLWQPELIWLHAVSDAVIGVSYFAIPLALAYFVSRRKDIAFGWIFWLFAAFILACGTTHFMAILTLWNPVYGVEALVKVGTAAISLLTAAMLWPLVIKALAFPTPAAFREVSQQAAIREAERNQALSRLRQSEETFRFLVNGVTDYAIFMLDAGGRVATWNTGAERLKRYTEREILGQHFSAFYTQDDRDAGLPARVLETVQREGRYDGEGWRVRKDGSRFWAHVVVDPLRDDAGRLVGYAKVTRDITERRQAEQALEQTRAALAQAQKMETIGQLAGGVAHDFNNLLTAILGGASLLERRASERLDGEARKLLAGIREAAKRAATLTHQLLAFSRKQTLAPQVAEVNRLVMGASELLRRTLGEGVAIETVLAGGLWRTCVDPNQLENAVLNLAVNARDAMPDGGRLTLETGNVLLDESYAAAQPDVTPGQYVMVAVSDTGTGMSEEVMRKAFEPFFTTKPEGRGTGLGLSQVFGFVKQSGGHIKLYSELGRGTTVKIYLPRHLAEGDREVVAELPYADVPRGSETILVVEDHDNVREYVTNALGHLGYRVLEAAEGRRALEILADHPEVALLLTDVGLPGINGRHLADQARQRAPGMRVVFMTAYARNAIGHHGLLDVGIHLLPKPFTVDALARKLREVLDGVRR
ncbi:PAS domain S-box protein [Paracraurococcus lichenis]|uniref:histidine kinase n=1 Tax=Paracraurococcus lichenis TaxID=3064888 RepID=A0ABT9E7Q9_9PROT|nr:PAS domain S-box protein [Paracraurococcus sp. LOR1-02]MDO9712237.1 PAS domain S-box protein [Paracraurococcus sp. LOR1-02]